MSKEINSPPNAFLAARVRRIESGIHILSGLNSVIGTSDGPDKYNPARAESEEDKNLRIKKIGEVKSKIGSVSLPYLAGVLLTTSEALSNLDKYSNNLSPETILSKRTSVFTTTSESLELKFELKRRGIRIEQVAERLGVNITTVYRHLSETQNKHSDIFVKRRSQILEMLEGS